MLTSHPAAAFPPTQLLTQPSRCLPTPPRLHFLTPSSGPTRPRAGEVSRYFYIGSATAPYHRHRQSPPIAIFSRAIFARLQVVIIIFSSAICAVKVFVQRSLCRKCAKSVGHSLSFPEDVRIDFGSLLYFITYIFAKCKLPVVFVRNNRPLSLATDQWDGS